MLTKILIFLAVLIGVFVVARMGAASAFKPDSSKRLRFGKPRKPGKSAQDLLPCPNCGAFVAPGETCDCTSRK